MGEIGPEEVESSITVALATLALLVLGAKNIGYAKKGREGLPGHIHGNIMLLTSLVLLVVGIHLRTLAIDERASPIAAYTMGAIFCGSLLATAYTGWWCRRATPIMMMVALTGGIFTIMSDAVFHYTHKEGWIAAWVWGGNFTIIAVVLLIITVEIGIWRQRKNKKSKH